MKYYYIQQEHGKTHGKSDFQILKLWLLRLIRSNKKVSLRHIASAKKNVDEIEGKS